MTEKSELVIIYIYIYLKEKGGVSHYDTTLEFEF